MIVGSYDRGARRTSPIPPLKGASAEGGDVSGVTTTCGGLNRERRERDEGRENRCGGDGKGPTKFRGKKAWGEGWGNMFVGGCGMNKGVYVLAVLAIGLAVAADLARPPGWDYSPGLLKLAPLGLILAIVALGWMRRNRQPGTWFFWIAVLVCTHASFSGMLVTMGELKEKAREATCISNLKQLGMAAMQYCEDYDDKFPLAGSWNESLLPYLKRLGKMTDAESRIAEDAPLPAVFKCYSATHYWLENGPDYGMNKAVSGVKKSMIADPDYTPLFFDSAPGWNRAGGPELLPSPSRHLYGKNIVCMVSGIARTVSGRQAEELRWRGK